MKSNTSLSITVVLLMLLLTVFIGISWVVNVVKLVQCDFDNPYKEEVLRGIGLIPIVAPFVAWQDFEEDTQD
jgi:hypothetical protein